MTDKDYTPEQAGEIAVHLAKTIGCEQAKHNRPPNEVLLCIEMIDIIDDCGGSAGCSVPKIWQLIQRQLAERDAEIERLKIDNEFLYSFVSCGTKYQIANHFRHKEPKP